jgi:hypothetical protein
VNTPWLAGRLAGVDTAKKPWRREPVSGQSSPSFSNRLPTGCVKCGTKPANAQMLYLDTSFITPLLVNEESSEAIEACLTRLPAGSMAISRWTRAEFGSLIARQVRMRRFSAAAAKLIIDEFGALVEQSCRVLLPTSSDYETALAYVTYFDSGLWSGDALHLAIARNHQAEKMLTLDEGLLKAAKLLDSVITRYPTKAQGSESARRRGMTTDSWRSA